MGLGFWFLIIEILLFEVLPIALIMFMNFFIGAGLGGLYSVLLESLMEKHFPV
jgi:FLVCR family feline leukemia virus subgroup C receptor-related protein